MNADELRQVKETLIRRALSGQHLQGWLPGGNHAAAISHKVGGRCGGSLVVGGQHLMHQTHRKGVGAYEDYWDAARDENRLLFLTWADLLDVVAQGVNPERLAEYERASKMWGDWHHEHRDDWRSDNRHLSADERADLIEERYQSWHAVEEPYQAAKDAIIEAGLAAEQEMTLF